MYYDEWFKKNEAQIWDEFFEFLRIPSISADDHYHPDLLKAADFVHHKLEKMGLKVERFNEIDKPVVFGEKIAGEGYPTVLIYGHYDVQPPDPLELWDSKPFEPEIRDGRIYARGAEDNKGQNFYSLLAIQAFLEKHDNPKLNIKVFIEGGEEIGSEGIDIVAKNRKERLKADSVWIVDMGMGSYEKPTLTLGVRGISAMEVTVTNSDYDLHSGEFGGAVYNPIQALCEMMASTFDEDGHIKIEGFYDSMKSLSAEEKKQLYFGTEQAVYEKETGAKCFRKEKGYTPHEVIGTRPTFELNGMWGGYTGPGSKTVLPKEAHAKITCRLVDGQEPHDIEAKVEKHLKKVAPAGLKVKVEFGHGGESAWARPGQYSAQVFSKVMEEVTGQKCHFTYSGGSIPLTTILAEASGGEYVFLGTALPSDRIHSPNENFSIRQFIDGYRMIAKGLEVFAENKKEW